MLDDAQEQFRRGVDIVVGYVEAGDSPEARRLMQDLPALPRKRYPGGDGRDEFDLDAALKRRPAVPHSRSEE
jgi:two-component system sensor histidine kinase KdpD